jgi:ABC-type multidrug transport system ATPase subunit
MPDTVMSNEIHPPGCGQSSWHGVTLLVLDEPTAGLDPITRKAIIELLYSINQEFGTTLVITTHDIWLAATLCKKIAVLREGRVVAHCNAGGIRKLQPGT